MSGSVTNQVIIQARTGSTRLPGKVLKMLAGHRVIDHVVYRCSRALNVDRVVVATTEETGDDEIENCCKEMGVPCVRGSSDDVLARFIKASVRFPSKNIVRITADCPMVDPAIIDCLLALHVSGRNDYTSNVIRPAFPPGFDAEVVATETLQRVHHIASLKSHREHVTLYIRENLENFKTGSLVWTGPDVNARLTLDRQEDYEVIRDVFDELLAAGRLFSLYQVIELVSRKPELFEKNLDIDRFEGLHKSLDAENRECTI